MNRKMLTFVLASFALLSSLAFATAQQSGTAVEAKAMFDRAIAALKTNETAALAAFNDKSNKDYHDRDLYVFCYHMNDGKFVAHPSPVVMGVDVRTLKFKNDPFGQRGYDAIKGSPEGNVTILDYDFPKPGTSEPVPKESYITRVGNEGCGVGYYK